MTDSKRRLLDALRDPQAGKVVKPTVPEEKPAPKPKVKPPAKKAAATGSPKRTTPKRKRRKKPRRPKPKGKVPEGLDVSQWPEGWVLDDSRCRGITKPGEQCARAQATKGCWCGTHKKQTMEHVAIEAAKRSPARHGDPTEKQHEGERTEGDDSDTSEHDIGRPPPERTCQAVIDGSDGESRRCGAWTIRIDDDKFDAYCLNHSKNPRALRTVAERDRKNAEQLKAFNEYSAAQRTPVFNRELKTQDDVAEARLRVMRKVEAGVLGSTQANVLSNMLDRVSNHIERYGAHQGAEGGAGVLRLLPGVTLVQMNTEIDTIITKEQLDEIELRLAEDEKAGVETPGEFSDVLERYLGIKTRKRDRSRQYEGDD